VNLILASRVRFKALRAPARFSVEAGQGLPPFPLTLSPLSGNLPPLRSGQVSLDEAEHRDGDGHA
jgi:hypothetical protein